MHGVPKVLGPFLVGAVKALGTNTNFTHEGAVGLFLDFVRVTGTDEYIVVTIFEAPFQTALIIVFRALVLRSSSFPRRIHELRHNMLDVLRRQQPFQLLANVW